MDIPVTWIVAIILGAITFFLVSRTEQNVKNHQKKKKNEEELEDDTTTSNRKMTDAEKAEADSEPSNKPSTSSTSAGAGVATVERLPNARKITLVYCTMKGTSRSLTHKLFSSIQLKQYDPTKIYPTKIINAAEYDPENLVNEDTVIFVVPTYEGGNPPEDAQTFATLLKDISSDFRYGAAHLKKVNFAVFGLGDKAYGADRFNRFAKDLVEWMKALGAHSLCAPVYSGESQVTTLFPIFTKNVLKFLDKKVLAVKAAAASSAAAVAGDKEADEEDEELQGASDDEGDDGEDLGDLEDIVEGEEGSGSGKTTKQLLYPRLEKNLTKQGYAIVGTHSGVKLCRWTKSMLRGRGGCYKHTFYNISSYQCMEMTPSLACANKCVFCWRHHTNPVAKQFEWEMDSPEFLVQTALAKHRGMIKQMKGVPGVKPERLAEAMRVRHCALSLVGEPIMYPEISRFVELLHKEKISSFMVTNSQFPERIRQLSPVTQIYCSIDAANKEELKRIDRPLFEDFWERCVQSIKELSFKRQRTVFRLTLVGGYNMKAVKDYASLVRLGNPDFIEVKGVTYCGESGASGLTMKNVPFHEEVLKFCVDIVNEINGNQSKAAEEDEFAKRDEVFRSAFTSGNSPAKPAVPYSVACEHAHSCCVLISKDIFKINGQWHTWIDYDKFFELCESGRTDFDSLEYAAPTPDWAVYQSKEQGFDPQETRVYRKKKLDGETDTESAFGEVEEAGC